MAPVHGVESDAKLAFVEFLLTSIDIQESARRAVDWLLAHAPVSATAVLVSERSSGDMLLVAEHGVSSTAIIDFSLTREDDSHPLIRALDSPEPMFIERLASHHRVPLESDTFHVIPLRADTSDPAHGLLLVAGAAPPIDGETLWLGRTLGKQVSRLMGRQLLAETRFGQERMLLYSIINAVTDPILLTDTEGKLIIANSHAEKLFAAPEEASEGWRRAPEEAGEAGRPAAGLKNLFFWAALSTSAVGMGELARRELLLVDPLEG